MRRHFFVNPFLIAIFVYSQNGETPLHGAAMFGHLSVVKQLLAAGSNITIKNHDGMTPLKVAQQQNYTTVIEYLKEKEMNLIKTKQ